MRPTRIVDQRTDVHKTYNGLFLDDCYALYLRS
ncbi:unnamed protein product [Callosobruchus maculatus]|uniref:Uncharacterized protein n=1 Tax=Callosobruchus maculatus TaxID=64391 RepID=A0A653CVD1_CALMS|nr:unnamed protein product [Callosobruchus maculatus]